MFRYEIPLSSGKFRYGAEQVPVCSGESLHVPVSHGTVIIDFFYNLTKDFKKNSQIQLFLPVL